uniref:acetate--CoA ligase n=1 Tax=Acrobeloides nanus TaxID=290746 RepID=A0A914C3N4_9BILA
MAVYVGRFGFRLARQGFQHGKGRIMQRVMMESTYASAQPRLEEVREEWERFLVEPQQMPEPKIDEPRSKIGKEEPPRNLLEHHPEEIFHPPEKLQENAHIRGMDMYQQLYRESIEDLDRYWKQVASELYFEKHSDKGLEWNFDHRKGDVFVKFLDGAKTNIAYNCLERNIQKGLGSKIAYIWEGNEPGDYKTITYSELLEQVVKFSEVLRSKGVRKGDVVAIYMPMVLELPVALLACARIGASHSVVFAGFSADSLASRIQQAKAKLMKRYRCAMNSGSTGTPKGLVHTTAGFMTYAYHSVKTVFDAKPEDIYWCTADAGWITGHTCVVYGPLLNGLTSIIFEGIPTYPNGSRVWQIVEKYKATQLYTSPTAVRSLMAYPNEMVTAHSRDSLKIIGVAGENTNPSAWLWLHRLVGGNKCSILDLYWQTENGGPMITPLPGATPLKPGSATLPFFGIEPALVNEKGDQLEGAAEGYLCFARAWPGMARTIWRDHERFVKTYFSTYPGYYFTGDGAKRDQDSYYWITGRVDDQFNVSGHLLSTAEVEAALMQHPDVVESAVVATKHSSKGQVPYAFVVLAFGKYLTPELAAEIKQVVRSKIGAFAVPEIVHPAPGLPKNRSGKVLRRILRIIADGDQAKNLGDTTTLLDESVIEQLWETRPDIKLNANE